MKKIALTAALLLASSLVMAAPPSPHDAHAARETAPVPKTMTPEQFEAQKQKIVQALDKQVKTFEKQLKVLKDSRGCVVAAAQPDQVRDCMASLRVATPRGDERGQHHGKQGSAPGQGGPVAGNAGSASPRP